ncbi:MAG: tetratricopeptide repeat protein, partial [bacterium]
MSRTQQMIGVSALLGVAVLVTYGQVLGHGFINLDDDQYVTANSMVLGGLTVDGVVRSLIEFASFNWHPMTWMSHMLDVSLFGMAPSRHHATNVLLHTANTVMLFWILANAT